MTGGSHSPAADPAPADGEGPEGTLVIEFPDNPGLPLLYGPQEENLERAGQLLDASFAATGNRLSISGPERVLASRVFRALYRKARSGESISPDSIGVAVRLVRSGLQEVADRIQVRMAGGACLRPRSPGQILYLQALMDSRNSVVLGVGPAGTGKTCLAVAAAVSALLARTVERIILCRPAVEAGEHIGFLPGDMQEKVDPYLRPLHDSLRLLLPVEQIRRRTGNGEIEIVPLGFMRGRTLSRAFVILDEAQNATPAQLRMFLTRLGEGSRMAVTGDPGQSDLPPDRAGALRDVVAILGNVQGVHTSRLGNEDIVRHPMVRKILEAYEAFARKQET